MLTAGSLFRQGANPGCLSTAGDFGEHARVQPRALLPCLALGAALCPLALAQNRDSPRPQAGASDVVMMDAGPEPAPGPDPATATAEDTAARADPTLGAGPASDLPPAVVVPVGGEPDAKAGAAGPDTRTSIAVDAAPRPDPSTPLADPDAEPAHTPTPGAEPPGAAQETGFGFGGIPALNYDSDNGLGFGLIGTLYWYDGETRPYRLAVTLQLFMTTKLVQDHNLQLDWLKAFGMPLRINARLGYLQSLTQNFCGFGGDLTCDPEIARAAGRDVGLSGEALETFARRYYQRRFMSPYGLVNLRWMLFEAKKPEHLRIELLAGYRGNGYIPGTFTDDDGDGAPDLTPYPGSLFEQKFPDGEGGFSSVLSAGVVVDTRDHEPYPTEGLFLEATVRGASPVWGSRWSYAGTNLSLRGFTPLNEARTLVIANRFIADAVIGDPPVQDLARLGGTLDNYVFGGGDLGRGIRVQRFLGKARLLNQAELRWRFLDFSVLEQKFALAAAGFADLGVVAASLEEPGPMPVQVGFGGGVRVGWNENFWIRFDVGVSPAERFAPGFYVLVNAPF
jgi:Omp85 superfamily domain